VDRCQGKTKSGTRCKRAAIEGSRFCATHASQEQRPEEADGPAATSQGPDTLDTLIVLAVAGAVLYAALTLRRFSWFL
jgi:hypothetical protein